METKHDVIKQGNIVDIFNQNIFFGELTIKGNTITEIKNLDNQREGTPFILPGFIDAHVHIESSMLAPSEFARLAVVHGTVGTISDPHEIANVCGMEGVNFMIENGKKVPFKFHFGAPSCVPATTFETAGAEITADDVNELLSRPEIVYLSEMMNFPGVLHNDPEVMKKIAFAKKYNKPVDGHAPGLRGDAAKQYIDAGISTDHECFTEEEAADKLHYGMKILIREGSAAKNFEALIPLLNNHADRMMFCSDDKHPDSLAINHINTLCARAVAKGNDVFKVLRVACINPVEHYKMNVGLLRKNDYADFICVENLTDFKVLETYINGECVATNGKSLIPHLRTEKINQFNCSKVNGAQFYAPYKEDTACYAIGALNGQLITENLPFTPLLENGCIQTDVANDLLKIVVVNRYKNATPAVAFIKNFGIKEGAIASTVAHDSHNIVAIGTNDEAIAGAVNAVIDKKGGISAVKGNIEMIVALPIAGLMTDEDGYDVAARYTAIDQFVKTEMECSLTSPFMTLSFMALLVIPHLKLSDKGLFDGDTFMFINNP